MVVVTVLLGETETDLDEVSVIDFVADSVVESVEVGVSVWVVVEVGV